ncbi:MAG: ABC transporter substrate-binding protein [Saccharospirillaceae bacterium]|nr:ABC transporter substrate-binding protein [Saccharospirillaceae bacterium]MCD8532224.1 ABC transporter substrate-binding protein [Saccharospirillaceae bacterium]
MMFIPINTRHTLLLTVLISCLLLSRTAYAGIDVTERPSSELANVVWQSNDQSPVWSDDRAQSAGILRQALLQFPPNIRRTGPETPHSLSATLDKLHLPLVARHPHDSQWIPMLASRWLLNEASDRLYFELDADARWSDGIAVSTDDLRFTLQFLTNPETGANWQAEQLQRLIKQVEIFDQQRFAFVLQAPATTTAISELASLRLFAAHIYRNARGWPKSFDWYPEPTTGPYYLAQINHNAHIVLRKTSDWWGLDKTYFKHRFNVRRVILRIPDNNEQAIDLLERGELDTIPLNNPENWSSERITRLSQNKRIDRIQHYHQATLPFNGLLLNADNPLLLQRSQRSAVLAAINPERAISAVDGAVKHLPLFNKTDNSEPTNWSSEHSVLPSTLRLIYSNNQDQTILHQLQQNAATAGLDLQLKKVSPQVLNHALATADYDLAWISISTTLNAEGFNSLFQDNKGHVFIAGKKIRQFLAEADGNHEQRASLTEQFLLNESIFRYGYGFPYSRSANWQWIKLPDSTGTRISNDLFDPFDPVTGGLFWIHRKDRADILAQPERAKSSNNQPKINIQYRLNIDQPR